MEDPLEKRVEELAIRYGGNVHYAKEGDDFLVIYLPFVSIYVKRDDVRAMTDGEWWNFTVWLDRGRL